MNDYEKWNNLLNNILNKSVNYLKNIPKNENNCVIFDIDDTLININGKCIEQIKYIFDYSKNNGFIPVIITNRSGTKNVIEYTTKQLYNCGITGHKSVYFRPPKKTDPYFYKKNARLHVKERGLNTVMSFGDMPWDIGEYGGLGIIIPVYKI